jgi:ubiquinone/menaquinone biosynthesis C-methylase UbiE
VARSVSLGELYLGTEGAALFRHLLDGDDGFVIDRVNALRTLVAQLDDPQLSTAVPVPELDVDAGYTAWSAVYDAMSNALIRAEEPLVHTAAADLPRGRALDAACGTGRHAAWLAADGHDTTGVDATEAMLEIARAKVPDADFQQGDFEALPFDDGSFDFAICALALTHRPDPTAAICELARVVRPGGQVILTDAHPAFVLIQGQALFPAGRGLAFVRNYPHLHSTYLRAFRAADLVVAECLESEMDGDFSGGILEPVADAAAGLWSGIPVALVWSLRKPGG